MNDFLTNGTEIKQRIISEINNSTKSIFLAMAYFTDRDIAMAIVEAKNRNVTVDIILSSNLQNETVKLMLKGANISVHAFETGDARGIMHHKFCLIDNRISINGSFNYSLNASNNNVENITVSDDITIYTQMLTEFERLKYNIDNRIAVNDTLSVNKLENIVHETQPLNHIDIFNKRLNDLVFSASDIDTAKYRQQGLDNSRESQGNLNIFRSEYENIKERIKIFATDEGLGSKKNTLTANIKYAYESTKTNIDNEKQEKINVAKRNYDIDLKLINENILEIKKDKNILESGNTNTGEKGVLQVNKEIEKNKIEKSSLEQTFIIKKFWSLSTILSIIGLIIFSFFLSIFFASAVYKVFFEENVIRALSLAGANPKIPQLIDANAIYKITTSQGLVFGVFSAFFFIIPILLTNLKLFGNDNKYLFVFFLIIFDVVTSSMVAFNQDYIRCLIEGKQSTLQIWEVLKHGEFWLIFLFGSAPLFLTHYLINFISDSYKSSRKDIVDSEKHNRIQHLDKEMIDLVAEKDLLTGKISLKDEAIKIQNEKLLKLNSEINNIDNQINAKYDDLQYHIKTIFDDYYARIISGKIFTDVIFSSIVSAYKSGFIEYLPMYYSAEQVASRVKEIEQSIDIKI